MLRIMLNDMYERKPKVLSASKDLKNLIFLQLESYPNEIAQDPKISPNLYNFSKRYEFIAPINCEPYTKWSLAGASITETGIPQIYPDPEWHSGANSNDYKYIQRIQGIPNILETINYKLNYISTGINEVMGYENWILSHNYTKIYQAKNDLYLFEYLTNQFLPKLDQEFHETKQKTLTLILNAETHSPYKRPKWCRIERDISDKMKCFACIDFALSKFINKFLTLKMYENTLLVVFPDHFPYFMDQRELFILFSGIEKINPNLRIKDEITYYDFAPTILDMIGIYQYEPEFPFGRVFYRNTLNNHQKYCTSDFCILKHPKPNVDDLAFLYKFIHFEHALNIRPYNVSNPFACQINGTKQFYYSDRPCVNNIRVYRAYN